MILHGLGDSWGGGMIVKNPLPRGVMIVKTGGGMILKNPAPEWGHVSEKSHVGAACHGPGIQLASGLGLAVTVGQGRARPRRRLG